MTKKETWSALMGQVECQIEERRLRLGESEKALERVEQRYQELLKRRQSDVDVRQATAVLPGGSSLSGQLVNLLASRRKRQPESNEREFVESVRQRSAKRREISALKQELSQLSAKKRVYEQRMEALEKQSARQSQRRDTAELELIAQNTRGTDES